MSAPSPEQPRVVAAKGLGGALTRFRIMAFVTGVVLATMVFVGMPLKAIQDPDPSWYAVGWMAHGWLYIAYVAVTLDLVFRLKWHLGRALLIMLAGTVPLMSFVAERYVTTRVQPIIDATRTPTATPADAASVQR